jgi:hypothetical protein
VRAALIHDADADVRRLAVAVLAETEGHDLLRLSVQGTPELLYALAGNRSLGREGLRHLVGHPDPVVAGRAQETLFALARAASAPGGAEPWAGADRGKHRRATP